MGKIKFKRGTVSDFASIKKDEDTLYAVNENGDFSEDSIEETAELYIGDKKIVSNGLKTPVPIGLKDAVTSTPVDFDGTKGVLIPVDSLKEAYLEWGGKNKLGTYSPLDACLINDMRGDRFAFFPTNSISIEYSQDGGVVWNDYNASDNDKLYLFASSTSGGIKVGGKNGAVGNVNNMVRVTLSTANNLYAALKKFVLYITNNSGASADKLPYCTISGRKQVYVESNNDTWDVLEDKVSLTGWSGYNVINTSPIITYGNTKNSQYGQIRFTFGLRDIVNNNNIGLIIHSIRAFGEYYTAPNTFSKTGMMYSYDIYQNVTFPNGITNSGDLKLATNNLSKVAVGYNSYAQLMTSNSGKPYATIKKISPTAITIGGSTVCGSLIAPNETVAYTYGGTEYNVTNTNSSYYRYVVLLNDTGNEIIASNNFPFAKITIHNNNVINFGTFVSKKLITGNIYEFVVSMDTGSTALAFSRSTFLLLPAATSSKNGDSTICMGALCVATGTYSTNMGYYNNTSGYASFALGRNNYCTSQQSLAIGSNNVSTGYYSVAIGESNMTNNYYGVAIGNKNDAKTNYCVLLGTGNTVADNYQVVLGRYNQPNATDAFQLGWGSETARENIFSVTKEGLAIAKKGFKGNLQGNADSATKVNESIVITKSNGDTVEWDGSERLEISLNESSSPSIEMETLNAVSLSANTSAILKRYITLAETTIFDINVTFSVRKGLSNPANIDVYLTCDGDVVSRTYCIIPNVLDSTGNTPLVSCYLKGVIKGSNKNWVLQAYTTTNGVSVKTDDGSSYMYITEY